MEPSNLLSFFRGLRKIGDGRYVALCPCHDDHSPSLAITITQEGVILMYCFACNASGTNICQALQIDPSSLFPKANRCSYRKRPKIGFSALQILCALHDSMLVLSIALQRLINGESLPKSDLEYLIKIVSQLHDSFTFLEDSQRENFKT